MCSSKNFKGITCCVVVALLVLACASKSANGCWDIVMFSIVLKSIDEFNLGYSSDLCFLVVLGIEFRTFLSCLCNLARNSQRQGAIFKMLHFSLKSTLSIEYVSRLLMVLIRAPLILKGNFSALFMSEL